MISWKKFHVITVIFVLLTALLFCGMALGAGKKLVVASFYPIDKVSGWKGVVEIFKKKHPDVDVEVQVTSGGEYLPKLLAQIASGTAPDVIGVENTWVPEFYEKNVMQDLTSYMMRTKGFTKKDFFPHLLKRYTIKGRVYGIPYDCQPVACLFYNKRLFQEAGIPFPNDSWRWDDLLNAAKKLTKAQGDRIIQYGFDPQGNWLYFVYTNGGFLVDKVDNPTKCLLGNAKAINGVKFYLDLMYKHKVSPSPAFIQSSGATPIDLFLTGRVAMSYGGFWTAVEHPKEFRDLNAGLVIAPAGPTGIRRYPTGGTMYTITRTSKIPEIAWDFITIWMGPEGHKAAYESAELGAIYPPAHIPSFKWYISQPNPFIENIQVNGEASKYAVFNPFHIRWSEISSRIVTPEMDLVLRNQKPVEETMKDIAEKVTAEFKKK